MDTDTGTAEDGGRRGEEGREGESSSGSGSCRKHLGHCRIS